MSQEQLTQTLNSRVNLMRQNKEIQKAIADFECKERAQDWIIQKAIASLISEGK